MEPKMKVSNSLALRKVAALTKGDLKEEDCVMISFLIGSEDSVAEEIRACKFDLVVASEYFQGLLRSPFTPDGPIRIKHVEPDTFRLVVEFTHLSGHLVSEVNDLEQCLKLAAAADEFLLDELGQLCTEKLEELINVDNVWTVFSKNHLIKYTSAVCEKLLSLKTEECLNNPAFLEIDESAWVKFLNIKEMSIKSEMQLVLASLEFINGKVDERAVFRQCALPYLRLLTLSADDLSKLAPFLENEEKMLLILNNLEGDSLLMKNDLLMNTTHLCKNTKQRNPLEEKKQEKKDFVPAELLCYRSKICESDYRRYHYTWSSEKLVFTVDGSKNMKLNDFLRISDQLQRDDVILSFSMDHEGWIFKTTATVTATTEDGICIQSVDLDFSEDFNICDMFVPSILNVTKGGKVQVEVTLYKTFNFADLEDISDPEEKKSLEELLQMLRKYGKEFSLVVPTCECPHLNMVKPVPNKGNYLSERYRNCSEDDWICLTCYEVFNYNNVARHNKQHHHPLTLGFSNLDVCCVECKEYVDAPAFFEAKNAVHLAKFGTEMSWTYGGEIKIE